MGDDFIFDDENRKSDILKKILVFGGIGLCLLAILFALVFSSIMGGIDKCREVANNTDISLITRCEDDNKFEQIIFVVGDTANTPKPQMNDEYADIISYMYILNNRNGLSYMSVSEPDSSPKTFELRKQSAEKIKEKVISQIESSRAVVDGADYLEAIRNAAGYARDKEKTLIYIIGSGLSDSGLLNFAEDKVLTKNIDEIKNYVASNVKDKNELSGLTIVWDGLGETVSPQVPLRQEIKNDLNEIYRTVFRELGVSDDHFIKTNHPKKEYLKNDVTVSVKTTETEFEICKISTFSADSSELAFYPGKAEFKDQTAAKEAIGRIAKDCSDAYYVIKPFMSRGWCDGKKDDSLLRERALATKDLLNSVGINDSNIEIQDGEIGDANECPKGFGHYPVNENEASKNRVIKISVIRK